MSVYSHMNLDSLVSKWESEIGRDKAILLAVGTPITQVLSMTDSTAASMLETVEKVHKTGSL